MSALTKPTVVPTDSSKIGTSFCTTVATVTIGIGGAEAGDPGTTRVLQLITAMETRSAEDASVLLKIRQTSQRSCKSKALFRLSTGENLQLLLTSPTMHSGDLRASRAKTRDVRRRAASKCTIPQCSRIAGSGSSASIGLFFTFGSRMRSHVN